MTNTFKTLSTLTIGGESIDYYSLPALEAQFPRVARLPFSLKILLENLLRREDGTFVKAISSTTATANATRSCAGARPHSATSAWFRPRPASCTR